MSWMITCLTTGVVFETFDRDGAEKAKSLNHVKIETAREYLGRINEEIKAKAQQQESGNE